MREVPPSCERGILVAYKRGMPVLMSEVSLSCARGIPVSYKRGIPVLCARYPCALSEVALVDTLDGACRGWHTVAGRGRQQHLARSLSLSQSLSRCLSLSLSLSLSFSHLLLELLEH